MADLRAKSPCEGLLPVMVGGLSLSEVDPGMLTLIAPFKGKDVQVSAALEKAHGVALPAPNRTTGKGDVRAVWFGLGQTLLMGPAPAVSKGAAVTDQSDGWCVVRLEGAGAEDALARLVPVDLRAATFKRGHTVRTLVQHMTASITRVGPAAFQIMVFRSMAQTLVHDLKTAMEVVQARR